MDVLMPQLGETVSSGKITTWFKKVGDTVAPGDNLFEIETDKTSMDVEATAAGVITDIRVGNGVEAPVGAVVAVISAPGTALVASAPAAASVAPAAPQKAATAPIAAPAPVQAQVQQPLGPVKLDPFHEVRTPIGNYGPAKLASGIAITPLARRLAAQAGIDPAGISGSGPKGRVIKVDIERAKATRPAAASAAPAGGPAYREIPLNNFRKVVARRLTEAKQTVPHFYLTIDTTIDKLLALRAEVNASLAAQKSEAKVSVNDFVIKAVALALRKVPAANASFTETAIREYTDVDISVAVATPNGLITPIIKRADQKSLVQISTEMKGLAARARDGKLKPEEFQGGTFSISNLGMFGVKQFEAIINPPQGCILAVGAGEQRPVVKDGQIAVATQMSCTLSVDHRVVDGAVGAEFLAAFKPLLEDPLLLLI